MSPPPQKPSEVPVKARRILTAAVAMPAAVFGPLLACGGNSSPKSPDAHITVYKDAPNNQQMDAPGQPVCTATASYATPTFGSPQAVDYPATGSGSAMSPHELDYSASLNTDASPDIFVLQLYAGYGAFGSGDIRPGTYQITGADAAYSTCGICPFIVTDLHMTGSGAQAITDFYAATGGTVTLTTVAGSNFSGSVSNLAFAHVAIGSSGPSDTPVGDCNSAITSGTLSAAIVSGSAAFVGAPHGPVLFHRYF
jgi:hypothetical protein